MFEPHTSVYVLHIFNFYIFLQVTFIIRVCFREYFPQVGLPHILKTLMLERNIIFVFLAMVYISTDLFSLLFLDLYKMRMLLSSQHNKSEKFQQVEGNLLLTYHNDSYFLVNNIAIDGSYV